QSGVRIGHRNSSLHKGTYEFLFTKGMDKLILRSKLSSNDSNIEYTKPLQVKHLMTKTLQKDVGYQVILEMKIIDYLKNIRVESLDEDFVFELSPTNWKDMEDPVSCSSQNTGLLAGVIPCSITEILLIFESIFLFVLLFVLN
ncbi:unnamed protein product, partial [Meganyctiphanes norvegica]